MGSRRHERLEQRDDAWQTKAQLQSSHAPEPRMLLMQRRHLHDVNCALVKKTMLECLHPKASRIHGFWLPSAAHRCSLPSIQPLANVPEATLPINIS